MIRFFYSATLVYPGGIASSTARNNYAGPREVLLPRMLTTMNRDFKMFQILSLISNHQSPFVEKLGGSRSTLRHPYVETMADGNSSRSTTEKQ